MGLSIICNFDYHRLISAIPCLCSLCFAGLQGQRARNWGLLWCEVLGASLPSQQDCACVHHLRCFEMWKALTAPPKAGRSAARQERSALLPREAHLREHWRGHQYVFLLQQQKNTKNYWLQRELWRRLRIQLVHRPRFDTITWKLLQTLQRLLFQEPPQHPLANSLLRRNLCTASMRHGLQSSHAHSPCKGLRCSLAAFDLLHIGGDLVAT